MSAGRQPPGRQRGLLGRLVDTDRMETVLAGLLAALVVVLDVLTNQPRQPLALDLLACTAAALTARWPRAAGVALGLVLVAYVFIPSDWATLGEYALMIPILGSGMRGRRRLRAVMSVGYFLILAAIAVADAPNDKNPIAGWLAWAVLIATVGLIGNLFWVSAQAHLKARQAELLLQRQALARELHDTVARSLARVTMAAERARLRGHASDADLAVISDAARRSTDELRWVMAILRERDEGREWRGSGEVPLEGTLAQAERDLAAHGFDVATSVTGPLDRLSPDQAEVFSEVAAEAAANIIKHAEPDTACGLIVDVGDTAAEMVFVNRPRTGEGSPARGAGSMGLENIRARLAKVDGVLLIDDQPGQWTLRSTVALANAERPPERVA